MSTKRLCKQNYTTLPNFCMIPILLKKCICKCSDLYVDFGGLPTKYRCNLSVHVLTISLPSVAITKSLGE